MPFAKGVRQNVMPGKSGRLSTNKMYEIAERCRQDGESYKEMTKNQSNSPVMSVLAKFASGNWTGRRVF